MSDHKCRCGHGETMHDMVMGNCRGFCGKYACDCRAFSVSAIHATPAMGLQQQAQKQAAAAQMAEQQMAQVRSAGLQMLHAYGLCALDEARVKDHQVLVDKANMDNLVKSEAEYRRRANSLSDTCGSLKSANDMLLIENARLRREVERLERLQRGRK